MDPYQRGLLRSLYLNIHTICQPYHTRALVLHPLACTCLHVNRNHMSDAWAHTCLVTLLNECWNAQWRVERDLVSLL